MSDEQTRPDFLPPAFGTVGYQEFVEIRVPAAVSFRPQTSGWAVLAALAVVVAALGIWRAVRRHRANAYRRAALAELRALRAQAATVEGRDVAVGRLPALLKRCALAAYARESVAALSGDAWLRFLDRTAPGAFEGAAQEALQALVVLDPGDVPSSSDASLFAGAERWLRGHRA